MFTLFYQSDGFCILALHLLDKERIMHYSQFQSFSLPSSSLLLGSCMSGPDIVEKSSAP